MNIDEAVARLEKHLLDRGFDGRLIAHGNVIEMQIRITDGHQPDTACGNIGADSTGVFDEQMVEAFFQSFCVAIQGRMQCMGAPSGDAQGEEIAHLMRKEDPKQVPGLIVNWLYTTTCAIAFCSCGRKTRVQTPQFCFFKCPACGKVYGVGYTVKLIELPPPMATEVHKWGPFLKTGVLLPEIQEGQVKP